MHPSTDRRQFARSLAGGATAGLLPTFASRTVQAAGEGDFLLTDGLTYLNTGTIGPSRRATVAATQRAWEMLEANPIAHYGQRVGAPMLEDTRTVAAKFLGCDLDEMAVTAPTATITAL
jgi:cysteine desulfurase/selenocysteine lyase